MLAPRLLLCLPLLTAPAAAQVPQTVPHERYGILVERLERHMASDRIPGLTLVVVRADEQLFSEGLGLADIEARTPATPATVFAVGEVTEAFTATLIGMLVEDGRMRWEDPVALHLEGLELPIRTPEKKAVVTIEDLLAHRTGLLRMRPLWAGGRVSPTEIRHTLELAQPWTIFRQRFLESDITYLVAGLASASAAGRDWNRLMENRILGPLGMDRSSMQSDDPRITDHCARSYRWNADRQVLEPLPARSRDACAPAVGLNASALDLGRWIRMQLGQGLFRGERLISPRELERTWSQQVRAGQGSGYGLGWYVRSWRNRTLIERGGTADGFSAHVAFLPGEDLGFALLWNAESGALGRAAAEIVFGTLLGRGGDAEPVDQEIAAPWLGDYRADFAPYRGASVRVRERAGRLVLHVPGQPPTEMSPPGPDGWLASAYAPGTSIRFRADDEGRALALLLRRGGLVHELPRVGAPPPTAGSDEARLERYTGSYATELFADDLGVLVRNGRLAVDFPGQIVYELEPPDELNRRAFRAQPRSAIEFIEKEDGAMSLILHRGGQRNGMRRREAGVPALDDVLALRGAAQRREATDELGPLRITGSARLLHVGLEGTFEVLLHPDGRHCTRVDFGRFARFATAWDGERGWTWSSTERSGEPAEELSGARLAELRTSPPFGPLAELDACWDELQVLRHGERRGRPIVVLEGRTDPLCGARIELDAETGDLLRIEREALSGSGVSHSEDRILAGHRAVGDLRIPHRVAISSVALGTLELAVEDVETGVELAPDAFSGPARR